MAIEILPTSNVRICCAKSFDDYHFKHWYQWKAEGIPMPEIVVGTDDTGIFSTNLHNEYICLYEILERSFNDSIARSEINTIIASAHKYKF